MSVQEMTYEEWIDEGERRFGQEPMEWRVVCPSCGHVQTPRDFMKFVPEDLMSKLWAFSCIGRVDGVHGNVDMGTKPGPCNYTSGGFFNISPFKVKFPNGKVQSAFAFDEVSS